MNPRGSVGSSVGAWTISGGIHRFAMGTRKGSSEAVMNVLYITKYFMSMNNPQSSTGLDTAGCIPALRKSSGASRALAEAPERKPCHFELVLGIVNVPAAEVRFAFCPDGIEVSRGVGDGLGVVA